MADEPKKELDPEVDIKFTVDEQIRAEYKRLGIIQSNDIDEDDEDKTSTLNLGSAISNDDEVALEIPASEGDPTLEMNTVDLEISNMDESPDLPVVEERVEEPEKPAETVTKSRLIFFDYKSEFFAYLIKELDQGLNYKIVEEFEELPRELQAGGETILFLNYSAYPKLCSQLIPKVKSKFKNVKIVIVAKNLTAEKIQAHKSSAEGVHEYLSFPFSREDFFRVIS